MSHTPTPWTLAYEDLFMGHHGPATLCDSTPQPIEMNPDNIVLIVRAVNAFEPMREALKLAKKNLQFLPPDDVVEQIDAALALADKEKP